MKKFIKQARLPQGAYKKDLGEVTGRYQRNKQFNARPEDVRQESWDVSIERNKGEYLYAVVCQRCKRQVLRYRASTRLVPYELKHCGVTDIFYVTEVTHEDL